jgi:hypothetical protein
LTVRGLRATDSEYFLTVRGLRATDSEYFLTVRGLRATDSEYILIESLHFLSVGSAFEGIGSEKIRNGLQSKIVVLPLERDLFAGKAKLDDRPIKTRKSVIFSF